MEVTKKARPWVSALPQPGWGGCTLAGYIEAVGLRPEIRGEDEEIRGVLDRMVETGHAQLAGPVSIDDPDYTVPEGDEPRWELTEDSHDALTAMIDPEEGATAAEVMLELQPGITTSAAKAEVD